MSPVKTPFVVLASGRGSNFEAIAQAIEAGRLHADLRAVISDKPDAGVLDRARSSGIRAVAVPSKGLSRAEHDQKILEAVREFSPRFLVMAGYMRIVSPGLIEAFRSERGYARIVNIHPSLLPAFPGVESYAQAFAHGAKVAGVTVHLVESEVDSGPICAQEAFAISDCASAEEVEARGLKIEHRLFPEALEWILPEKFNVTTRNCISKAPETRPKGASESADTKVAKQTLVPDIKRRLCVSPN